MCCTCVLRDRVLAGAQFSGLAQVNKVPNQLFMISNVILCHLILSLTPLRLSV